MSERMTPIDFRTLMNWIDTEYSRTGTIFGVQKIFHAGEKTLPIFGEQIETPFGPAAGPNAQLAQNLISAYAAGARFFEVKTVQKIDGDELASFIPRPCILSEDECYNQEWSTELTVSQAMEEYIKAWCAMKIMAKKYGFGNPDGFVINISVGYDLAGIQTSKMDTFINGMMDATKTEIFAYCLSVLEELFPEEEDFIHSISPKVSQSVTVSTLHGCPPKEIERIASYLIEEKGLNTFVKCNPTILGYETVRNTLDSMGYDYMVFDEHHFKEDLQYSDAVPMFARLQVLAKERGLEFGLKLSNTMPVDTTRGELPGNEMYMSGRSLFPLTIEMCHRISRDFKGQLRLSYAGGADYFNCDRLFEAGIWPITVATTLLKPGGYNRLYQMAQKIDNSTFQPFEGTNTDKIAVISQSCRTDYHHVKPVKPFTRSKNGRSVPILNCSTAPCKGGCPISQDIPEYLELCRKEQYDAAIKLICEKNPLPFITGTICSHRCQIRCNRNYYEESVHIRETKLLAAEKGYNAFLASICQPEAVHGKKVAIIGGGPTGIAAAYFLGRAGIDTTIYEREEKLGGIVRYVIPQFRILDSAIDKDISLMEHYGVKVQCGAPAPGVAELKAMGYTHILFAIGAWKPGRLDIPGNVQGVIGWMKAQKQNGAPVYGNVVIIGAGNTAMDAARLAVRSGAESATIVYRRTKRYMPADLHELELAIADGVRLIELASPMKQENGCLICERMILGAPDTSGRCRPIPTGDTFSIPCDLVISAVGEQVESDIFVKNGVELDNKGRAKFKTNVEGVYVAGDALHGPATVVEGIADAAEFAEVVIGKPYDYSIPESAYASINEICAKKGILCTAGNCEGERCLNCNSVCENCVDVCPNRANVVIEMENGSREVLHIDGMCNECGCCTTFCPYSSEPCHDKFTLFQSKNEFSESNNRGVLFLGGNRVLVRMDIEQEFELGKTNDLAPEIEDFILTIKNKYNYLLNEN